MKLSRVLPLTLLFATATVFGQNLVLQGHSPSLTVTGDCPVGLQVDHGPWFAMREVAGVSQPDLQQHLHLTVTNLRQRKIVRAEFTVHGLSQQTRFLGASTPLPDMVKRIGLSLEIDRNGQGSSDLSLHRFASVTTVDVDAVTYADGSSWRQPSPAACSVTPNMLMRVSTAQ